MGRMTNECMGGRGSYRGYGRAGRTNTNEHRYDKEEPTIYGGSPESPLVIKETAQIGELCVRIEKVWKEYQNLQDQYRKLTGRQHEWLR